MSQLTKSSYLDGLVEAIKQIDTTELTDTMDSNPISKIIEEQKTYFWIRVYVKDEQDMTPGDDVLINYTPDSEKLMTKFICYGKKGLDKDSGEQITEWVAEDDKKVLCLMIDEREVNFNSKIPFIRTLFKTGHHYEYQVIRRDELQFINQRTGIILDYFDVDF
jgi:hypothetical protein